MVRQNQWRGRIMRRVRTDSPSWTLGAYGLALLYALVLLIPLYFVFVAAFKENSEIFITPLAPPTRFSLDNLLRALEQGALVRALGISIFITASAEALTVLLAFPAAFAIARIRTRLSLLTEALFSLGFLIPALAILMPIVASMGGNAGTQTMTVAVRALATQDLGAVNAARVIGRETIVGLLNGFVFALIMGLVAFYWFGSGQLGMVIAAAMVINLLVAALSGILIPLGLHALDLDPAIASGVFVTTMTDCVGFFAFLGLAALWLT